MKHEVDCVPINWAFAVSEPRVTITTKKPPWHRRWRNKIYVFIGFSAASLRDKIADKIEDEIAGEIVDKIVDLVELLGSYIQRFRTNKIG